MNLLETIEKGFGRKIESISWNNLYERDAREVFNEHPYRKFLKFSIDNANNDIEIPLFALNTFKILKEDGSAVNTIVLPLFENNTSECYASASPIIKAVFSSNLYHGGFTRLYLANTPYHRYDYIGTYGAIFKKDFTPVWMCFWKLSRNGRIMPIIRYSPSLFLVKKDPIATCLTGKLFKDLMQSDILNPLSNNWEYCKIQLVIDNKFGDMQFLGVKPPNVNTNMQELIHQVIDNVDNFF